MNTKILNKNSFISARVDSRLKKEASSLLKGAGLSFSDFINLSLRQVVSDKAISFELKLLGGESEENYTKIKNCEHLRSVLKI